MEDLVTSTTTASPVIQAVVPTPTPVLPPQQHRAPSTTIRTLTEIDDATARRFYDLYLETFGELAIRAVNRHLLRREEFMAVMVDPRIDKIVIEDDATKELIAMCTLTNHLETVDWVSPEYFAHHYPDHWSRGAVYYLGFSLVASRRRRVQLFSELIAHVTRVVDADNAMCAWDICMFNNETIALDRAVEDIVNRTASFDVRAVDTQTYYTAVQVTSDERLRLPGQRPTV
jgi:hypothetical protein